MRKNYIFSFLFLSFFGLMSAQNLLGIYEFTGTGACPNQNPNVTTQPLNATFSSFNAQNVTCSSAQNVFNNSGWNTSVNLDTAEYIGFSITAADCYRVNLDSLVFSFRNSGTGTPMWFLRSSVDNYQTNIAAGTSSNPGTTLLTNPISLSASVFDANQAIEFRFYLTGMPANLNTFRVDDVKLHGSIDYVGPIDLYVDADGDGFGVGTVIQTFCSNPGGYATNNTDCDDTNPLLNPSTIWYEDLDNDGYGNNLQTQIGCTHTFSNAALLGEDCNENNPALTQQLYGMKMQIMMVLETLT